MWCLFGSETGLLVYMRVLCWQLWHYVSWTLEAVTNAEGIMDCIHYTYVNYSNENILFGKEMTVFQGVTKYRYVKFICDKNSNWSAIME
jgi:hypothetical protein